MYSMTPAFGALVIITVIAWKFTHVLSFLSNLKPIKGFWINMLARCNLATFYAVHQGNPRNALHVLHWIFFSSLPMPQ